MSPKVLLVLLSILNVVSAYPAMMDVFGKTAMRALAAKPWPPIHAPAEATNRNAKDLSHLKYDQLDMSQDVPKPVPNKIKTSSITQLPKISDDIDQGKSVPPPELKSATQLLFSKNPVQQKDETPKQYVPSMSRLILPNLVANMHHPTSDLS